MYVCKTLLIKKNDSKLIAITVLFIHIAFLKHATLISFPAIHRYTKGSVQTFKRHTSDTNLYRILRRMKLKTYKILNSFSTTKKH